LNVTINATVKMSGDSQREGTTTRQRHG